MKKEKTNYVIQTVTHALDLLEQFQGDEAELGVTELSRRLALHKNNVFRLLATLESRNYIEQNRATGNYRLGLKNLQLGQTILKQTGLLRQARPVLEALSDRTGETCYLAVLRDSYVVYLDVVESSLPVRVVSRLGAWFPVHCTAEGKVIMAAMTAAELARNLPDDLARHTPHSVIDREELLHQLQLAADRGYALDDEELDMGVRCVSAPVRDHSRKVVGAVSVSGPVMRFSMDRIQRELVPLVLDAAEESSARLGWHLDKAV